jgi:hypothetical protein
VRDWVGWHNAYDDVGSSLHRRLRIVQGLVVDALDQMPRRPIRVVSLCAGQGRDVIGALAEHPRRHEVTARLVELDEHNVGVARASARAAGLDGVEVMAADAGVTDSYLGAVPADLVVVCGVFGNIVDDDIAFAIEQLPQLCAEGAIVIWTRNREPVDLTTTIRKWFAAAGFGEVALVAPPDVSFAVGAHRLLGTPVRLSLGIRIFEFLDEQLPAR